MPAELQTMWVKGPLSHLERICLASMLKTGHKVTLHTYEGVDNAPEGVIVRDAAETLPYDNRYRRKATAKRPGNPGFTLFSDLFRCVLLEKGMGVWADLDCYFLRPIEVPPHGYLFGKERGTINNAVLHLPRDSEILRDMLAALRAPNKSPYWLDFRRKYVKRAAYALMGREWHLGEMGWGICGPKALTALVPRYGHEDKAQPMKAFYPVDSDEAKKLFDPEPFRRLVDDPGVKLIHIYAKERKNEPPVPGSFYEWATQNVSSYL